MCVCARRRINYFLNRNSLAHGCKRRGGASGVMTSKNTPRAAVINERASHIETISPSYTHTHTPQLQIHRRRVEYANSANALDILHPRDI